MSEEKAKKEAKIRTSITISPAVLEAVRAHAEREQISVSSVIEQAVRGVLKALEPVEASAE